MDFFYSWKCKKRKLTQGVYLHKYNYGGSIPKWHFKYLFSFAGNCLCHLLILTSYMLPIICVAYGDLCVSFLIVFSVRCYPVVKKAEYHLFKCFEYYIMFLLQIWKLHLGRKGGMGKLHLCDHWQLFNVFTLADWLRNMVIITRYFNISV